MKLFTISYIDHVAKPEVVAVESNIHQLHKGK